MKIDWDRVGYFSFASTIGTLAGWLGQPLIHGNDDATDIIVNVFSILAGFLVTIMTILGEPSLFRGRTWRADAVRRNNMYKRLVRHKWLFITYLIVLALIFVESLTRDKIATPSVTIWIERIYLGLASFAFIMSLALPSRLLAIQLSRLDEQVEERKVRGSSVEGQ